nr:hypothetical protein [Desulfobacterales bacterium]
MQAGEVLVLSRIDEDIFVFTPAQIAVAAGILPLKPENMLGCNRIIPIIFYDNSSIHPSWPFPHPHRSERRDPIDFS